MISFSKRNVLPTPVEKQTKVAGKNDICGNNTLTGRIKQAKTCKDLLPVPCNGVSEPSGNWDRKENKKLPRDPVRNPGQRSQEVSHSADPAVI